MLVDRFGPIRVLVIDGVLYAAGTASMALIDTPLGLHLGPGVLVGVGMSGASFITVHLPPYLGDLRMDPALAGWAIGIIGLANIVGAYGAGVLGNRRGRRGLLSIIYFGRAAAIAAFILLPPTPVTVAVFSLVMGVLRLSTVPLTSGLVAVMFGTRYMGMLFGFVFFSHQLGSFLGVWLGGTLYAATGSYEVVWWLTIALGLASGLIHWPIVEARAPRFAPAAA